MTQVGEAIKNALPDLEAIRRRSAEIAGTCQEHGEYTRGESARAEGQCPKCWASVKAQHEIRRRMARFCQEAGVPKRFSGYSLEDFEPPTASAKKVSAFMYKFSEDFHAHYEAGRSIVMAGRTGTGKTMLACATGLHIAIEHGRSCRYTTAYHIVRDIKDTYGGEGSEKEIVRGFVSPDLLIVDEVGVQYGTDAERLLMFEVLNGRYEAMKPTIVISNLELKGIGDYLGDRVMDRLRENGGAVLVFDWGSHRVKK